jgi:hypothetical protein
VVVPAAVYDTLDQFPREHTRLADRVGAARSPEGLSESAAQCRIECRQQALPFVTSAFVGTGRWHDWRHDCGTEPNYGDCVYLRLTSDHDDCRNAGEEELNPRCHISPMSRDAGSASAMRSAHASNQSNGLGPPNGAGSSMLSQPA